MEDGARRYGRHAHDRHKVLFCLRGSIVFHLDDGDVELHDGGTSGQAFQAGEAIFVPKGVPLGWRSMTDVKKIFVILMPNE